MEDSCRAKASRERCATSSPNVSPLPKPIVRRIAESYLCQLKETMANAGKTMQVDDDALELIATAGYSLAFGARFLKRVIEEQVKLPITTLWNDAPHFCVRAVDGAVRIDAVSVRSVAA